jgi:Ras-related protein Rab-21
VIASNKADLEENRVVSREQAESFSLKYNAMHVETSAKENIGIEELFKVLGHKVMSLSP